MQAVAQTAADKPAMGRLGLDLFSVRSQGWAGVQFLDYAAKLGLKVVHFSELRFLGPTDDASLDKLKQRAKELGIEIEVGMRSLCRSSKAFKPEEGTVEQQFTNALRIVKRLESPILRCFLGTFEDRVGSNPIDYHIEVMSKFLRSVRSQVVDAGIKVAVENHAGDMQARELKMLIEEAGTDFVGACIDSGNPLWALEDPHHTLEVLAPYVVTSHIRDSSVWRTPEGIAVEWVRSGEGNVRLGEWIKKFVKLCPGKTLSAEVICIPARTYKVYEDRFWVPYRTVPAWEYAKFERIAEQGKARPAFPKLTREESLVKEREDLDVSVAWMREILASA